MASGPRPVSAADSTYGSASTLSARSAAGSLVLTVTDYSRDKELHAAGHRLPSKARFTVGGCTWRITYSPNGTCQGTVDWICFGICHDLPPYGASADLDDIMVQTRYTMLDQAGQPVPSSITEEGEHAMSTMRSWSFTTFMKRERFESYYVKDNGFSVRCDVTLVRRTCWLFGVMPPPDNLGQYFGDLLASGVGADVTLEVGGETFLAHRCVLASRSRVFKAKLFGGPEHRDVVPMSRLRINGIEPSQFRVLLHFIYTDSLPMRW